MQRKANILPINLLRTVAEDVKIDGFEFPKGTLVIPQISILMNDPTVFEEPKKFNPERFICFFLNDISLKTSTFRSTADDQIGNSIKT